MIELPQHRNPKHDHKPQVSHIVERRLAAEVAHDGAFGVTRTMSIRRVIKLFALWTILGILGGAIIGLGIGLGDTGHVGSAGSILIFATAGSIFGVVGGVVFAPPFTWLSPQMPSGSVRAAVAAILGTVAGLLGAYLADQAIGLTNPFVVGSVAGATTGLACLALSVSESGHRKTSVEQAGTGEESQPVSSAKKRTSSAGGSHR